jgi:GNAT superfamily N-acetyltransferase
LQVNHQHDARLSQRIGGGRDKGSELWWRGFSFLIAKSTRRRGVAGRLLQAALDHVRDCGGRIVEGYPVEPKKGSTPNLFTYHGLASMFRSAGFKEVARRSETRPMMRYVIGSDGQLSN